MDDFDRCLDVLRLYTPRFFNKVNQAADEIAHAATSEKRLFYWRDVEQELLELTSAVAAARRALSATPT